MSTKEVEEFKEKHKKPFVDKAPYKVHDGENAGEKEPSGEEFESKGKKPFKDEVPYDVHDGENAGEKNPVIIDSAKRNIDYLNKKIREIKGRQ